MCGLIIILYLVHVILYYYHTFITNYRNLPLIPCSCLSIIAWYSPFNFWNCFKYKFELWLSDKCPCRTNVHKISYRFSDKCLCRTNVRVGQMSGYPWTVVRRARKFDSGNFWGASVVELPSVSNYSAWTVFIMTRLGLDSTAWDSTAWDSTACWNVLDRTSCHLNRSNNYLEAWNKQFAMQVGHSQQQYGIFWQQCTTWSNRQLARDFFWKVIETSLPEGRNAMRRETEESPIWSKPIIWMNLLFWKLVYLL